MEERRGSVAVRSGAARIDGGPDFRRGWNFTLDPATANEKPIAVHIASWYSGRLYPGQELIAKGEFNTDGTFVAEAIEDRATKATFARHPSPLEPNTVELQGTAYRTFDLLLPKGETYELRGFAFDLVPLAGEHSSPTSVIFRGRDCIGVVEDGHTMTVHGRFDEGKVLHADKVVDTAVHPNHTIRVKGFRRWPLQAQIVTAVIFAITPWVVLLIGIPGFETSENPGLIIIALVWSIIICVGLLFLVKKLAKIPK